MFVELLSGMDTATSGREFYNLLCEAVCRLTSMERAGLFLYDPGRQWVHAVGCHGIDPSLLKDVGGTLDETPLAQRALANDRVEEVSEALEREIPARYARFAGITTLTCTPVAAGGRWLGVIFADRGGGRFTLTDEERHAMWTLGKVAALAASARMATRQQEQARQLGERLDLARDIHERVVQRLFGLSLVLGSEGELTPMERRRCSEELGRALSDLRSALERPLAPSPRETGTTLREELTRLSQPDLDLPVEVGWLQGAEVPADLEPLAQSVLAEALRNVRKHSHPTQVGVVVERQDGAFVLNISNDGVTDDTHRPGVGLRLAASEAIHCGGVLEWGQSQPGIWRVRLAVPVGDA